MSPDTQAEGLGNLSFKQGDIFRLPFPDASFDLVWSKYVLQWVKDPASAVTEFRRVTAPGGKVVCCNFDGFAVTHWPEDPALQADVECVFPALVDPFIGRKMASFLAQAGLVDVTVRCQATCKTPPVTTRETQPPLRSRGETRWLTR